MGLSERRVRIEAASGGRSEVSLPRRVRTSLAREGVGKTLGKVLRRVTSPWLEIGDLVLFARDLEGSLPSAEAPEGWRVREAGAAELDAICEGSDPERPRELLRERFRRGHTCFVAELPGEGVGHVRWVTTEPPFVPEAGRRLELSPGAVYFYDGFTRSSARRRGLDGVVRCAIFRTMRDRGYRRAVSYVRGDNPPGLRAAGRWQEELGRMRYVRLGRRRTWLGGGGAIGDLEFSDAVESEDEEERADRSSRWNAWFEGWLSQPLERRSTGFSFLPDEYFAAVASFVAETLGVSSSSDRVLDVGCASAGVTRRLASRCHRLTGVDAVPGLLADAARAGIRSGSGEAARFVSSDGRVLPFRSEAFDKVYCVGVIHTLPTVEDGFRVVQELVRVCAPGGKVLVGALPDKSRRWRARAECWRRGSSRQRLEIVGSLLLPPPLKRALRRLMGRGPARDLVSLEYDLTAWRDRIERLGFSCEIVPFPEDFWSRDFRTTRSNLLVSVGE